MVDLNKSIDPRERAKERARAEREAFKHALDNQCYLVGRIEELAKYNSTMHSSGHPGYKFKHFSCLDDPNPSGTVTGFYNFNNMHELYNITPAEYAHLVPLLELSVVHRSPATKMEVARTDVPLQGTFINPRELLRNPGSRSQSLGLKSFSFELNGTDPYTAKKLIKASAVFHADSLVVFNKNHYMKLLSILDEKNNRLEHRYKVGWAVPENFPNKNLAHILRDAHMELICNYVHHTFDIGQDGTFTLTIEYVAAIDLALNRCDLLEFATKVNDKKSREETLLANKFTKFLRAKTSRETQNDLIENAGYQKSLLEENQTLIQEQNDIISYRQQLVDNEEMKDNPNRREIEQNQLAMGNARNRLRELEAQSEKLIKDHTDATDKTRPENLDSEVDKFMSTNLFRIQEVEVDEFIQNFTDEQKRKFKPMLMEMVNDYNRAKGIGSDTFGPRNSGDNANVIFSKFIKDYKTAKLKERNDDVFKMFVDKLETGKSKTTIHNILVSPNQFLGQLQKYQFSDGDGLQLSRTQDVEPEMLQSSVDAPESAEPNFSDPSVTPDAPPPKQQTVEGAADALMDGDTQNSDELVDELDFDPASQGKKAIPFFYFGDLFDILVEATEAQVPGKKLNFVLGTMPYISPGDGKRKIVSIADIPISYEAFRKWLHTNYIQKYTQLRLPLVNFLSNLFSQLIRPAFSGECFEGLGVLGATTNRITMHHKTLSNEVPKGRINMAAMKRITRNRGTDVECILFAANMDPALATGGSYEKDIEKGIFHFHLGRDRGLLKKATFAKYDMPNLKAHRMTMDNASAMDRIKEPYKCDLDLIGNNLIYPGVDFFVTPSVPGGESELVAMKLGVGGYYKALVVEHNISPNGYVTRVKGSVGTETQSSVGKPKPDTVAFIEKNSVESLANQAIKTAESTKNTDRDDIEARVKAAEAEAVQKFKEAREELRQQETKELDQTLDKASKTLEKITGKKSPRKITSVPTPRIGRQQSGGPKI